MMKKHYFYYFFSLVLAISILSCSTNDDSEISDQYLIANVNGLQFNSDNKLASLKFTREIGPEGILNLYVRAISTDGDTIEFLVENFQGPGKYYFGDKLYNNSWIRYEKALNSEQWVIAPRAALNLTSNFIEITTNGDDLIEGKISCKELRNGLDGIFGIIDGEFKLKRVP